MTLYTKHQLRNQTLVHLGVLDPTEQPDADTIALVDPVIQQMLEHLDDENCLIFDPSVDFDTDVIPGRVMLALRDLGAYILGPGYGKNYQEMTREMAMKQLRRSVIEGTNDIPTVIENF